MLLYIHIPFCTSKCGYCAFTSFVGEEAYFNNYIETLCVDLAHTLQDKHYCLSSIFIGGGTPNILSARHYETIFTLVHKYANLAPHCEITLEANVNLLSAQWCRDLCTLGANRLSVGVQSFDNAKLQYLEREHSAKDITHRMESAYNAGFGNLSCDLIINTPLDNKPLIAFELTSALKLPINHISIYALSIDEGSHFASKSSNKQCRTDEELIFYTREILQDRGFMQYEVSNYARENRQCKHNLGYWQGEEYLGCGAGAVGRVGKIRSRTCSHLKEYLQNPTKRHKEHLSEADLQTEAIMLGLRCTKGVDISSFSHILHSQALSDLLEGGKCELYMCGDRQFLRAKELFLSDEIALWIESRL
ncbi:radical SAM family heme chaperone HemW [uncultured Helicobacter sp.]|uniref:radical SAM family heme chaperone HemW n=3 Tax=uncultured Helicobacter sp. TaxID=175537 RepID=UPI0025D1011A|nr:radical SAM family heme chaperone HemW [uncultured Helicobacter sp.]